MNFLDLYKENRKAVVDALKSLWCGETANESQRAYAKHIEALIPELFAPSNAIPLVQCMNLYKSVVPEEANTAKNLVGGLWDKPEVKPYNPYAHQYRCWEVLLKERTADDKPKSICVTTGTGSGKTECFMMPLVHDLLQLQEEKQGEESNVQALFLYPLNALMEDQKERLEELLEGTGLKYAVYNGDLPEKMPGANDNSEEAEQIRKQIDQVRGITRNDQGEIVEHRFKHILYTREDVRKHRPNILLTNPTMLEYVLLRKKDEKLIDATAKSLKWVAIDETHTYSGAGAAELAMLLRRVLLAFGVTAEDVHFATSSATLGNGENPAEEEKQLKDFISGITGVRKDQVEVVGGERIGEKAIPNNEDKVRWERIFHDDFVTLASLFPEKRTIEEQLHSLDEMVNRMGDNTDMKVKVHYFYRVPNNGLYVRLDHINEDGTFQLYTENKLGKESDTPLVELTRCKNCGEYVAVVRRDKNEGVYHGIEPEDSDIFDLEDMNEEGDFETKVFALSKSRNKKGQGNSIYLLTTDNKLKPALPGEVNPEEWHLVSNQHTQCPYCNCKLTKQKDGDSELDAQTTQEISEEGTLSKFRLSAEFISRIMAPSVLDQLDKFTSPDGKRLLHDGQQYISFADSRQLAAKATLKQNQEQERMWFYSTIYHELCKRSLSKNSGESIADLQAQMNAAMAAQDFALVGTLGQKLAAAASQGNNGSSAILSWQDVAELLFENEYCNSFCYEFVKRTLGSEETDKNGNVTDEVKEKYVQSIMTMYLTTRPKSSAAPETMGLFLPCYDKLKNISVPTTVENTFNRDIQKEENRITNEDWKNLLQVFLDYRVRSDQSVYLELPNSNLDIFNTVRFAIEKSHRKPALKPELKQNKVSRSRIVRYLCALLRKDNPSLENDKEAYNTHFNSINVVIDAMWKDLVETTKILQVGRHYDKDKLRFVNDADGGIRMNLADMSFKLYENVYLADTNSEYDEVTNHAECLRPIETQFKGFSPYLQGGQAVMLDNNIFAKWKPYPHYIGNGEKKTVEEIVEWSKEERSNLWMEGRELWGNKGVFADRLNDIHHGPNLFLQAEHTAQVDKMISRKLQKKFKEHRINILACSTTMEMGVDLGTLQVVMLSSVPPQPANYKQRAGRSGRNHKMVRSACITLCGSDAIGLRTLISPLENIINRPVEVPKVDLMSPQVVQRHANSFLIRSLGVFGNGSVNQKVISFYTNFHIEHLGKGDWVVRDLSNRTQDPITKLGDPTETMYEIFNLKCDPVTISDDIRNNMELLLKDTIFEGKVNAVINKAKSENIRCHKELEERMEDVKCAYVGCTGNTNRDIRFRRKLNFDYMEILNKRLLSFWATHRFTPNANMPVSVLELNLDPVGKRNYGINTSASNPSYTIRDAISQYAPGNSVVVDGVVYAVRGIEFQNQYQGPSAFKRIARNSDETVMGDKVDTLSGKKEWWENTGRFVIELVEPVGFIPDINEEKTRIIDKNRFTHVSAQLLDANEWIDAISDVNKHLYTVRCNRDTGEAKILYYNEGIGYGFCLCTRCGRMVLETEVSKTDPTNPTTLNDLPHDYNTMAMKKIDETTGLKVIDNSKPRYHLAISGKEAGKKCSGSNDVKAIRRNVIIGGLLQTDFSEIKIRHKGHQWMHDRTTERNLLFTLGIVFTQALVEILGKDRNAVDFAILPFGHLCIFDTNPGGAGYSNQLVKEGMMEKVLSKSKQLLTIANEKHSKDFLLDKFTLRYMRYVDIQAALDWIAEEESVCNLLPTEIEKIFPVAQYKTQFATLYGLKKAFSESANPKTLFVLDDYSNWDYKGTEQGWRSELYHSFNMYPDSTNFCVVAKENARMPEPILSMVRSISGWTSAVTHIKSPYRDSPIYPLAYIEGKLYFTTEEVNATLDAQWGFSTLYSIEVDNFAANAQAIDTTPRPNTCIFKLEGEDNETILSRDYGKIIQNCSNGIIDQFIAYSKQTKGQLKVTYQDEHLKNVLGMVVTLQIIEHMIKQIGLDFELEFLLEEYVDTSYRTSITTNISSSDLRDELLQTITDGWLDNLKTNDGVLKKIVSLPRRSLTHWRVLSIQCGNKVLTIYPDGGFINGWNLSHVGNNKYYTIENTTTNDNIYITRIQDVKFDVNIKD